MTSRDDLSEAPTGSHGRPGRALAMVWVLAFVTVVALVVWLQLLGPPPRPPATASAPPASTAQPPPPLAANAQASAPSGAAADPAR